MSIINFIERVIFSSIGISFLTSLGVFLVLLLFRKFGLNIIFKILEKMTKKTKTTLDDNLVLIIKAPTKMLLTVSMFFIAYKVFDLSLFLSESSIVIVDSIALNLFRTAIIIFFYMILYNSVSDSKILFDELQVLFDIKVDKLLVPFVSKIFRLVLMVICIAAIATEWGFDVNGFVAGLGIGGLAFALAAKDTLANAFGGAVLITEKPFTIGDWIVVDGVEGTVEDINFRSTKIRKFNKSVVTVPNSVVAISNIINYSKRDIRRISYELKIRVETPVESVKVVTKDIKEMLVNHPGIDNDTIFVNFNKFGESSLNIFMYFFTNTSVWSEYLEIGEDTNFKILEILEKNNVTLAVPMQVIKVEKEA